MDPAAAAAAIITWLGDRDEAAVEQSLADPAQAAPLLAAAEAIADAADDGDDHVRGAGLQALFAGLIEPLNDGFTKAGRAVYARVFTHIVWRIASRDAVLHARLIEFGIRSEAMLLQRYRVARADVLPLPDEPVQRVVVLSRVTIGADILLTTVVLQRLHQRFPQATLVLLGDGKLSGLFGGLPNVRVRPLTYGRRGPLRDRLASWLTVVQAIDQESPDLVVGPDSRLDQLGVLPVTVDPAHYLLWENTQDGRPWQSLADRLDDWLAQRLAPVWGRRALPHLGFDAPAAQLAETLRAAFGPAPLAAVKLDHGGNAAKALPRAAEVQVLMRLRDRGWRILLDRGFGAEELANSDALLAACGWSAVDIDDSGKGLGADAATLAAGSLADTPVVRFHGSIAGWAGAVTAARVAISYDSVGHHLAAALGIPVVVVFTGYSDPEFPRAWQPRGSASVTLVEIPTSAKDDPAQWARVVAALPSP